MAARTVGDAWQLYLETVLARVKKEQNDRIISLEKLHFSRSGTSRVRQFNKKRLFQIKRIFGK